MAIARNPPPDVTESNGGSSEQKLILVSNRLPISVHRGSTGPEVRTSSGGLATGLRGLHEKGNGVWLGWNGLSGTLDAAELEQVAQKMRELRLESVDIPPDELKRFYEDFSNGVLWPLLHYLVDRMPLYTQDFEVYKRVNERFADAVAAHAGPDDLIWVHDYHLMLLPAMLRKRLPTARIGFFLHIPFPSSEVFRILPWREEILRGMLGADLIGFHTFSYARHFTTSILRLLGLEPQIDQLAYEGRQVRIGSFPMGIDVAHFEGLGSSVAVGAEAASIREAAAGKKILLGVDRLDYTKGIPRRLLAVERLLEREPAWRGKLRLVQLSVPSRERVDEYQEFRQSVELLVGRINGAYGTVDDVPIHYLYRSVPPQQLVAMYRAADVMVVTPLRDGMNLVAKEFVASRTDGDGVLVLSELAGASSELGEALMVNPYDIDQLATVLEQALMMPEDERRHRMETLRARVSSRTVHEWASGFVENLAATTPKHRNVDLRGRPDRIDALARELATEPSLLLLLDYDGTLVPLVRRPELASPDQPLLGLIRSLAVLPNTSVHVVSGRKREDIERFFGSLPIGLHAEHGLWSRLPNEQWRSNLQIDDAWKADIRPILEEYTARTPGAHIEEKTAGLVWHYRAADPQLGTLQAKELRPHLIELLAQQPVTVIPGSKVIEVRLAGVDKGLAVRAAMELSPKARVLAFGDDRTDEDMFAALPEGQISFALGAEPSKATHRLAHPDEVRTLLSALLKYRTERL